jgi:hypothetical protein
VRRLRIRLRPLSEAEAYARCHGMREAEVRIVHLEPRRPRYDLRVTGEDLRRSFERRLDSREPHEAASAGGPAAVDGQNGAGDEARTRAREVENGGGDVLRQARLAGERVELAQAGADSRVAD